MLSSDYAALIWEATTEQRADVSLNRMCFGYKIEMCPFLRVLLSQAQPFHGTFVLETGVRAYVLWVVPV